MLAILVIGIVISFLMLAMNTLNNHSEWLGNIISAVIAIILIAISFIAYKVTK
ncbi:hypothetical protein O0H49_11875 [Staphylococcus pseudintermedius]|nr:hypothetical protein [Staphylococcus pseudintermedius]MDK3844090.1 hypothetical protein [Staphylococcus pseudintermedius]